jgi:hypothetical protein
MRKVLIQVIMRGRVEAVVGVEAVISQQAVAL